MTNFYDNANPAQTDSRTVPVQPSRKPPKTAEQLLASAEKRIGLLRTKVLANRDRQRLELIDELYLKLGVKATPGDVSESKRIKELRAKLDL